MAGMVRSPRAAAARRSGTAGETCRPARFGVKCGRRRGGARKMRDPFAPPNERPPLRRPRRRRPGGRPPRLHPRRPQRAAGRRRPHHRGHPDPRLAAVHRDGARRRRRGDGHLAPRPADRRRAQARGLARAGRGAPRRAARPRRCRCGRTGSTASTSRRASSCVLENCRLNKGEKKNDPALAKKMAALCDVFVNDAFGTAHRAEASTYGIAEFAPVACAGPLLAAEIDAITQGAGAAEAAAGRDRRRLQGLDQARRSCRAWRRTSTG